MAGYVLHLSTEENITLSSATVKRLIAGGSGDAALLYLAILHARGAADSGKLARGLKWDETRLRAAEQALYEMKLVGAPEKKEEAPLPPPQQLSEPPEYTREDIARKLEGDGRFACLLREVEHKLGPLSTPSVKKLLGLYENLGLPADVVYTLVNYCIAKKEQQFGEGRLPNMREIEKEGYVWARKEALFHRKGQRVHEARASPARQVPRVHGGAANAGPRERAERGKVSLRVGGDGLSRRYGQRGLRPYDPALPRIPLAVLQRHFEALARKGPAHARRSEGRERQGAEQAEEEHQRRRQRLDEGIFESVTKAGEKDVLRWAADAPGAGALRRGQAAPRGEFPRARARGVYQVPAH